MNNSKGFTLTEIIVVLVILAVLAAFTIPTMLGYVSSSQEKLCNITRMDMTRLYKTSLIGKEASASTDGFKSFAIENWGSLSQCPAGGDYTYSASLGADGKVTAEILCSKHGSAHVLTTDEAAIPSKDGMKGVLGFGPPVSYYTGTATEIIIPNTLGGIIITGIYQGFFADKSLNSVTFDNNSELTRIHNKAFKNNNITKIDLPDSITRIDLNAFENNHLTEIELPNSLTLIEREAFIRNNITKITIGDGVIMEEKVFDNNDDFKTVYNAAGGGAGTYIFIDGKWEKQE